MAVHAVTRQVHRVTVYEARCAVRWSVDADDINSWLALQCKSFTVHGQPYGM